ncbi:MAG: RecX family transcriptional regulator [Anaerolineales bacterium]|nr:RecX family transcriptional regulator [Anaerolineales bacterium]
MKITALKLQARNKSRVNVFVDGSFAFGLVKNEAVRLRIGQELTEADVERLKAADAREEAYARALRLIDRRPRSTREVADNLKKNKVAPEDIEAAIARLGRAGLLNDAEFAKMWVENREAFRPSSKRALALELRRKGVADSEIKVAVAESNDAAAADRVAQTKAARFAKLPWPEFRLKLLGVLARRGFDFDTARSAVERAWKTATGGRAPGDFDE